MTYELYYNSEQESANRADSIHLLERRLRALENVVGTRGLAQGEMLGWDLASARGGSGDKNGNGKGSSGSGAPLMTSLKNLEERAALLESANLDKVTRR